MKKVSKKLSVAAVVSLALASSSLFASSHMDAPLITLDDPANTTDVYAFVSAGEDENGYKTKYLTTALAVYPFEEPGIGPNNYRFDDNVLYEIHIALGKDSDKGRATLSYQFRFKTEFENDQTIRQAFLGEIDCRREFLDDDGFPTNQNLRQTYAVTKVDHRVRKRKTHRKKYYHQRNFHRDGRRTRLGTGRVPPNNQGLLTPQYNTADDRGTVGEGVAKGGVNSEADLDACTKFGITKLRRGHRAFAGQRDDGFYADIQSIFDLDFTFGGGPPNDFGPNKPFDSQGGFNVHTIVLNIPLRELYGAKRAGVYATTSRQERTRLRDGKSFKKRGDRFRGGFVQVGRQGNPLFNEALIALERKDLYNRTDPTRDDDLFREFAQNPELGTNDVSGVFIPDLIRVDLTTGPVPLAGQPGFSRLGPFGGDPGGFPNGRRFGDDVLDIAFIALGISTAPSAAGPGGPFDGVDQNDITFNDVFPYAATPLNGRNHGHHQRP